MASTFSAPRATCPYLNANRGRTVTVIGKVVQLRGDSAIIDADGEINVTLPNNTRLEGGNAAQIIGKVQDDLSLKTLSATDLGVGVDFELAKAVAEISQKNKEIFGGQ